MCLLAIFMSFGEMSIQVFCPFFGSFFYYCIYLFLVALGLHCFAWAFSSGGKWVLLFVVGHGLIAMAALVVDHQLQTFRFQQLQHTGSVVATHGLQGTQTPVVSAPGPGSYRLEALEHRFSSCGAQVQLLRGMWNLPGPGIKPMSPALAGRFLSTVPLRKFLLPIFEFFSINELYKLLIYLGN